MLGSVFNLIRRLFSPKLPARTQSAWDPNRFVYVKVPGGIQLWERFEDPLQIVPSEPRLGNISSGGSQIDEPNPDGSVRVLFCGIEMTAPNRDTARQWLMKKILELAAPSGTEIHYTKDDIKLIDRFVNGTWIEGEARTSGKRLHRYSYHHPDGIRVEIDFQFERSYDNQTTYHLYFDLIAGHIAISNPKSLEVLLKQHIHDESDRQPPKVQHILNILSQSCGQLVTIVRFERFDPRPPPDPKAPAVAMAVRRA
jgi:hypothetical protein